MFFLSPSSVRYAYLNSDPMFSANIEFTIPVQSGDQSSTLTYYEADLWVYVMGCTDQYQICNPTGPGLDGEPTRCTALGSLNALPSGESTK
jgi:hypothetical protein